MIAIRLQCQEVTTKIMNVVVDGRLVMKAVESQ
jgi:hypothetical protein